jgi:hypothetical protein
MTGNHFGVDLNANLILKQNISLTGGYSTYTRSAKTKPDDYYVGDMAVLMFYTIPGPKDKSSNYQILVGKIINLKSSYKIRFNPSVGVGYTNTSYATQWEYTPSSSWSSNYSYELSSTQTYSLIIKPKVDFLLTKLLGLSLSPVCILNNGNNSYYGINTGIMFGKVRD